MTPIKEVLAPHLGRNVKFGRRRPIASGPHLRLRNYLKASLPSPPTSVSYTGNAGASLSNVYQNDSLGDCVIAALWHLLGVWTGNANGGSPVIATPAQIVSMYSSIGGYVPGQPSTDQGCDMPTAMNWICANGFPNGDKPLGYVAVDGTNFTEVQTAIWLFEGIDFGMSLPDAWISPFPSSNGFTWDVAGAPDPQNGHSIMAAGYDSSSVTIDTWALLGKLTAKAVATYATQSAGGELYALLSADMIAKGAAKAPSGFDWASLVADFDALGANVPVPQPPSPPPVPGTPVTLAQAQAWAAAGIESGDPLQTQVQAATNAGAGLATSWPKS